MRKISQRAAAAAAALIMSLTANAVISEGLTAYAAVYSKTAAAPNANVKPGVYENTRYVKLTSSTSNARIFYTLDGTDPTINSDEYKNYIRLKGKAGESISYTIRAIAVKTGYENSDISEFNYTIEIPSEMDVIYMELHDLPNKRSYRKGDALDVSGGTLLVTYEDHSYKEISMTEKMISGFNSNTAGEKTLVINYKGFTDSFTIKVSDSTGNVNIGSGSGVDSIIGEEPAQETGPRISGASEYGWNAVIAALINATPGSTVTIDMNDTMSVPTEILRISRAKVLTLDFTGIGEGMKWTIEAGKLTAAGLTGAGVGVRTSAIYIPKNYITQLGGSAEKVLHFNSDNKHSAVFGIELGKENIGKYASLFRFDSATRSMELVSTAKIDSTGTAKLIHKVSGDHVIIVDKTTRIPGDLSNDMKLTQTDVYMLMSIVTGSRAYDSRADVNGDGKVNLDDATKLYREIANNS